MDEEKPFGDIAAKKFKVGDIVEWTTWSSHEEEWEPHYGVLVSLKNELRSNRLVSISKVLPLNGIGNEMEFFTLSLKLLSRTKEEIS
jgi:hypothetical protein|tara:strand:+ start:1934 stop:2194 length:261 start_codon:yes stop_codon:yes gene_type:complete